MSKKYNWVSRDLDIEGVPCKETNILSQIPESLWLSWHKYVFQTQEEILFYNPFFNPNVNPPVFVSTPTDPSKEKILYWSSNNTHTNPPTYEGIKSILNVADVILPKEDGNFLNITIGDIYIYNYCNENHVAEVISVDKSSGMSYIKLVAGSYKGTNMWVRPDLLEEITGDRQETADECQCGAKHTSNPKFHLNYCPLVGRK